MKVVTITFVATFLYVSFIFVKTKTFNSLANL